MKTVTRLFLVLVSLTPFAAGAQAVQPSNSGSNEPATSPRDAKGHIQSFDCGRLIGKQGQPHEPHKCDPVDFSKVLRKAKTVAVVTMPSIYMDGDDRRRLRDRAATLIKAWRRFQIVSNPESADLILQLVDLRSPTNEPAPIIQVYVFARGANPETDDVVWMETDFPKWPESDTLEGALELLRKDIEECEKLDPK